MRNPALEAVATGAPREIRLEDLVGRVVLDVDGERLGRIEELRAEWRDRECVVLEYHVGAHAAFERLGGGRFWSSLLRVCGAGGTVQVVPWQQMDIRDLLHPRLTCRKGELPGSDSSNS